jgi:outer membrane protein OmpA-like peptidoglycan-associated protein
MRPALFTAQLSALLLALAACGSTGTDGALYFPEAGMPAGTAALGEATLNNTQIQNGQKPYLVDLAQRFSSEVTTTVNFDFNSAALDAGAKEVLRGQAAWIRQYPEVKFRVYGHADTVGSPAANKALGQRRAHTVVNYLVSQGISRHRLEAAVSFGAAQPVVATEGRERRNRRTVTEVSGFWKRQPTVMNGRFGEGLYRDYLASGQPASTLQGNTWGQKAE